MSLKALDLAFEQDRQEGLEPGTTLERTFNEIDEGNKADSTLRLAELQADPSILLKEMLEWCDGDYPENPAEILEVTGVRVEHGFYGTTETVTGRYRRVNGSIRCFKWYLTKENSWEDGPNSDADLKDGNQPFSLHEPKPDAYKANKDLYHENL